MIGRKQKEGRKWRKKEENEERNKKWRNKEREEAMIDYFYY